MHIHINKTLIKMRQTSACFSITFLILAAVDGSHRIERGAPDRDSFDCRGIHESDAQS